MNNKMKALVFGATSAIIIIAAITTITLWPTQKDNDQPKGDGDNGDHSDRDMSDQSKFNLVNLHYRVTNHTIISTTTTVVVGCLILIILFYVSRQRKRKRDKREKKERERNSHRDYNPAPYTTNGTWATMDTPTWMPWGLPGGHQPQPQGHIPQPAPRLQREDGPQELALVHAPAARTNNEDVPKLGTQWKHTN